MKKGRTDPPGAGKESRSRVIDDANASKKGSPESHTGQNFTVVGIGASAGGLEAFTQLLKNIPLDTAMAFVLVQHLDPDHESALTSILSRATQLPVSVVVDGQRVEPNQIHVIPRDTSLTVEQGVLKLKPRAPGRVPHHPIDVFFESLAIDQRERAIGVVLSGTATDGTLGLEAIKAEGGITFAQDDSAKHDSMPKSAIAAGVVDLVLTPADIAKELSELAKHPLASRRVLNVSVGGNEDQGIAAEKGEASSMREVEQAKNDQTRTNSPEESYQKILQLLRGHSSVDFSLYRSTTIQRRIERRLLLNKKDDFADYAKFLRGNAIELDALYSDVLISVTSFFRNPELFDSLQREVFPPLVGQRTDEPVRVWVLGCSTGQEAYSIAMAFVESAAKVMSGRQLQVFATDLNDKLLEKARHGLYAKNLAQDISPERLRRFFVEEDGGYRINKSLRDMVVFARQNLINDPPFSRMDIVSCRNLLIYLEPALQKKAMPTFHYALRPGGFLVLGASESVGGFTDLFEQVDKKNKLFLKKPAPTPSFHLPVRSERYTQTVAAALPSVDADRANSGEDAKSGLRGELNAHREADRVAVSRFAPPGVLINESLQVLQFRGQTGAYLEVPSGRATFDVLKMAREGLMLPLRNVINRAKKENKTARMDNVRITRNREAFSVSIEVIPLRNLRERCFLVFFLEPGQGETLLPVARPPKVSKTEETGRVAELESDIEGLREFLQSVQEQNEATSGELQAANEEAQSANEELQSINEELETSKEELESANEELTTVNEEMAYRNAELKRVGEDLVNLQTSTKLAVILLGRDLTIRRFSAEAEREFDLLSADIGRPIGYLRHGLEGIDLEAMAAEVVENVREQQVEVHNKAGRWFSLRMRPYITSENKVDGVVVLLVEIEVIKRAEQAMTEARDYAENVIATVRDPLLVLDSALRIESANAAFYTTFHANPAETVGRHIYEVGNKDWDVPRLRELLEEVLPDSTTIEGFLVEHEFEKIGMRSMQLYARRIEDPQRKTHRILLVIEDITSRKHEEATLEELNELLKAELAATQHLQKVSAQLIEAGDIKGLFDHIVNAAAEIMRSEMASLQTVDVENDGLKLLAYRGFGPGFEDVFSLCGKEAKTACTLALAKGHRIVVPDVEADPVLGQADSLVNHRDFRIRAVQSTPLTSRDGRVLGVISTHWHTVHQPSHGDLNRFDILARQAADLMDRVESAAALRDSEIRFRRLFQTAKDGILILDARTGKVISANAFMASLVGLQPEELLGKELYEIGLFKDQKENQQAFRDLQKDKYIRHDNLPLQHRNGEVVEVELIGNIYEEDNKLVAQCNIRDVSERIRMQEKISQQGVLMAIESRRKDEFLAMLSHELRNPLAPIHSAVQLLKLEENGENLNQKQAYEVIERQVGNLTRLVSDLMEVSRVISGRIHLNLKLLDVNQVLRHAVETVTPIYTLHRHDLKLHLCEEAVWVNGDATRLEEVFVNLLSNAAKYTPDGGKVEIWCEISSEARRVQVRIRDNGVGIEKELLPRIFDLFTQADRSLDRSAGGLGIGLSLAHQLVALHGGTIEAFSPPDGGEAGSEFVVRLNPVTSPFSEPVAAAEEVKRAGPSGTRVLIVEDNVDLVSMLAGALRHKGYSVQYAYNGSDGLQLAIKWRPDIILLDIGLPEIDGYEVARRLRAESATSKTRLIALTGYGQDSDIKLVNEAGFDAHLIKPAELEDLERVMDPAWDKDPR